MDRLPPLNAMRAFEVVARLGSFRLAAKELGTSSAAVSQHVSNLAEFFGKQLFTRSGNRLLMTDAGNTIYKPTSRAFSEIAQVTGRILEGEVRPRLVVSTSLSLAELWLAPRLASLMTLHPLIAIDVRSEDDPVDLAHYGIDLRVSLGNFHYPHLRSVQLFHDDVLPVCSPGFWQTHAGMQQKLDTIHESAFIHTDWGPSYGSHPTWAEWFEHAGLRRSPDPARGRRVGLSSVAVAAARSGLGIALAQHVLARADLEAGRLITLSKNHMKLGQANYAVFPDRNLPNRQEIDNLLSYMQH